MKKLLKDLFFSFLMLLISNVGCGGDDHNPPPPPQYRKTLTLRS